MARRRTKKRVRIWILGVVAAAAVAAGAEAAEPEPFQAWLEGFRREALARGIDAGVLDAAFAGLRPIPRVIELDRRQPEFVQTFWAYLDARVSDRRVERGRAMLVEHARLLDRVTTRYGVPARFIVALWGLESNFGDFTGDFPVIGALATLAHDLRRTGFFRDQLLAALGLIQKGDLGATVKGSWAGAMGPFQFIPTTYRDFAVDFDGDGRRDHWLSLADMFASAANYLARSGWRREETWGREVRLPAGFDLDLTDLGTEKTVAEWQRLGVRRADRGNLPTSDIRASIVVPAGATGPAFMVYGNYRAVLTWNRSHLYAVAVGHLADRLAGAGALLTPRPAHETPLSRADVIELQRRLAERGFDPGGADGVIGPDTRNAIKAFQRQAKLPPDGYPTSALLQRLRGG